MSVQPKPSFIEKFAEGLGVILKLDLEDGKIEPMSDPGDLSNYPPPENGMTGWSMKRQHGPAKRRGIIRLFPLHASTANPDADF